MQLFCRNVVYAFNSLGPQMQRFNHCWVICSIVVCSRVCVWHVLRISDNSSRYSSSLIFISLFLINIGALSHQRMDWGHVKGKHATYFIFNFSCRWSLCQISLLDLNLMHYFLNLCIITVTVFKLNYKVAKGHSANTTFFHPFTCSPSQKNFFS